MTDEEWLLFRAAHHIPDELALLRREHLELHLAVEVLAEAAATRGQARDAQLRILMHTQPSGRVPNFKNRSSRSTAWLGSIRSASG